MESGLQGEASRGLGESCMVSRTRSRKAREHAPVAQPGKGRYSLDATCSLWYNPRMIVKCKECKKEFDKLLSDIKRTRNNFCSVSCASSYNGRLRSGPYRGMGDVRTRARKIRSSGFSYRAISEKLDVPVSTIGNWVGDIRIDRSQLKVLESGTAKRAEKPLYDLRTNSPVRRRLIRDRGHVCEVCGLSDWGGLPIWLEVHHIDGKENTEDNVVLVCLNCHSLTDNYRNKISPS